MNRYRYIRSLLIRNGIMHKDLAEELKTSRQCITGVVNGKSKSRRVQEHIARRLNRDFEKLWGKAA